MNKLIIIAFCTISLSIFLVKYADSRMLNNKQTDNSSAQTKDDLGHFSTYQIPEIKNSDAYTIILVGDSMTDYLGENSDYLRKYLTVYYPSKTFGIFNYGFGSTNILSLDERLKQESHYRDHTFPPILGREFDIIIIESFGHNPLSNYPLEQGLALQEKALDSAMQELTTQKPNSLVIFLATLAPSEKFYAKGVVELTDQERSAWVAERKAYIENHIKYAKAHNIPLIDIYHQSITNSDINLSLINLNDHIHPSNLGIDMISKEIADFLFKNNILPLN